MNIHRSKFNNIADQLIVYTRRLRVLAILIFFLTLHIFSLVNNRAEIVYSMGGDYSDLPDALTILAAISYYISLDIVYLLPFLIIILLINKFVFSRIHFKTGLKILLLRTKLFKLRNLLLLIVLIVSFLNLLYISYNYSERIIHVGDEYGYLFTAKALSQGKFSLQPPAFPEFFERSIIVEDKWISQYSPGHPLLLVPGILIRQEWLVPPILATITALLVFQVAKLLFDQRIAWLALLLLIFSPFYQMSSVNFMSHNSALFIGMSLIYFLVKFLQTRKSWLLFYISFFAFFMVVVRVYTGLFFALPLGLILLLKLDYRKPKKLLKSFLFLILGSALPLLLFGFYNYSITGSFFKTTLSLGWYSPFGINENRPLPSALMDLLTNVYLLRKTLLSLPSFITFSGISLFILTFRNKISHWIVVLPVLSLFTAYIFYKGSWMMYGPRFWYEGLGLLTIITSVGFFKVADLLGIFTSKIRKSQKIVIEGITIFIIVILSSISINQWYRINVPPAWHQDFTPRNIGDLKGFNWANSVLLNNIKSKGITNAIIFIKPGIQWWNYMVPANTMYFTDKDPIIFVKDLGDEENQKIINQYEPSGRKLYRADYDTGEVEGYSNSVEEE